VVRRENAALTHEAETSIQPDVESRDRKSYPRRRGHHPVGEDEQVQADQLEDILEEADDLQSEHVLERNNKK